MTKNTTSPRRQEIEALLPWHAAGTLSRRDAERVEQALANDNELARQYEMVCEELGETIRLNETLGAPSARAMERLMSAIEADVATARKPRIAFNISAWIAEQVAQLSPRTLAWSATAAALAIVLQAGLIAGLYVAGAQNTSKGFETASYQPSKSATDAAAGAFLLIRFAPDATAGDVTKLLEANKAIVVEGPHAGGLFKVRVSPASLPREELGQIAKRIQGDGKLIRFAAPTE